ncbi:hypothetical protein R3P38DRAFT_3233798 [Favolaschia claudopus]|uniref:Phosducin thioredoxin-like domain-containing protein n=1 Tax=Favolaschia claudopus TaxID=2862362 RepID=A0AAV9ZI10_9AGAR
MFSYEEQPPAESAPPPKVYKTPMSAESAKQYNANHDAHAQRKAAEQRRREQEKQFEHQIRVYFWTKDGDEPQCAREQGILLQKLSLVDTDDIDIYDFDSGCFCREEVNHVLEVPRSKVLLIRHVGVRECPQLDIFINKHRPAPSTAGSQGEPALASSARRNTLDIIPVYHPVFFFVVSITIVSIAIVASSFHTLIVPRHLPPGSHSPSPSSIIDRPGFFLGKRARSQPARPRHLAGGATSPLQDCISDVSFSQGRWYQQVRAWKESDQSERDAAAQLPRTGAGLWTTWRAKSTGWAAVSEKKRR